MFNLRKIVKKFLMNLKKTRWKFKRAMGTIKEENRRKFKRWWKRVLKQFKEQNLMKNLRNMKISEKRLRKIISGNLTAFLEGDKNGVNGLMQFGLMFSPSGLQFLQEFHSNLRELCAIFKKFYSVIKKFLFNLRKMYSILKENVTQFSREFHVILKKISRTI